jgi:hypothetical protein
MTVLNTKLVLSVLGVALLATPAFAQRPHQQSSQQQSTQFQGPTNDVIVNGRYAGTDPDPNVRNELNKDAGDWGPSVNGN